MKKTKTIILIALIAIAMMFCSFPVVNAAEYINPSAPTYTTYKDKDGIDQEYIFANGTPIVISARTDGNSGALITWDGGEKLVGPNTSVFGGGHDHDGVYKTTSVTMNSGTIHNLIGGGMHKSNVETANVTVNGGNLTSIQGAGASSYSRARDCGCSLGYGHWYAGNAEQSPCRVETANVTINGGIVSSTVYGGGEGISYTGTANLKINNGDMSKAWVTAGGSNGCTKNATVTVNDGTIKILQSVNRGSMETATTTVNGGKVETLYVGGENDASVTGTISSSNVAIKSGEVNNLKIGTSGGTNIPTNSDKVDVSFVEGTVTNVDKTTFPEIVEKVIVTIDGTDFELNKGSKLTDISTLDTIKTKPGHTFSKFVDKNNNSFAENTAINTNITLSTVFTINSYKVKVGNKELDANYGTTIGSLDLNGFKVKDGYTFKHFVLAGTDTVITDKMKITSNIELTPVFVESGNGIENPDTSDFAVFYVVIAIIALVGIIVVYYKKNA